MSVNAAADNFEVFKFEETGVVALCQEVAALASSGELSTRFDVDPNTGRYVFESGLHKIVFDYRPAVVNP